MTIRFPRLLIAGWSFRPRPGPIRSQEVWASSATTPSAPDSPAPGSAEQRPPSDVQAGLKPLPHPPGGPQQPQPGGRELSEGARGSELRGVQFPREPNPPGDQPSAPRTRRPDACKGRFQGWGLGSAPQDRGPGDGARCPAGRAQPVSRQDPGRPSETRVGPAGKEVAGHSPEPHSGRRGGADVRLPRPRPEVLRSAARSLPPALAHEPPPDAQPRTAGPEGRGREGRGGAGRKSPGEERPRARTTWA